MPDCYFGGIEGYVSNFPSIQNDKGVLLSYGECQNEQYHKKKIGVINY